MLKEIILIHSLLYSIALIPSNTPKTTLHHKVHRPRTIQDIVQTLNKQFKLTKENDTATIVTILNNSKPLKKVSFAKIDIIIKNHLYKYHEKQGRWYNHS